MNKKNYPLRKGFQVLASCCTLLFIIQLPAVTAAENIPANNNARQVAISIIIDDMGYRLKAGRRAVNLPGAITYSFLPHSPHAIKLSKLAHAQDKEVMLHLPMEAESGIKLGPGGLTHDMTENNFITVLEENINSIPFISGFNNHMGSLLTKSSLWMNRLMQKVASINNIYFVDSKTTNRSVALKMARAEGIQSIQRDIFIDHIESKEFIQQQLKKLIIKAKRKGTALAIAHPKKITLQVLEKWLPELKSQGVNLVPVSKLIEIQQKIKLTLWQKQIQP